MLRYSLSLGGGPLTEDPGVQTDVGLVRDSHQILITPILYS